MAILPQIESSWAKVLESEFGKPYFNSLLEFIEKEYKDERVFPNRAEIFRAFELTPFENVKVVLLGQDPYHTPGLAHGLSFSVWDGVKFPPSLVNIFKELKADLGLDPPFSGNLERWAKQGVLLLNTTLTVREGKAGSHHGMGWELFTDAVIENLNAGQKNLVYLLWGAQAQSKGRNIDSTQNLILEAPHPSPLSVYRGFSGCGHFSKTNRYLAAKGKTPIQW